MPVGSVAVAVPYVLTMLSLLQLVLCFLGLHILLLPAGAQLTTSRELYVKPTEVTSCPEPCHTLDEYVQNASQYFVSNTTFNFLPGNHSLSQPLNVSGATNLALVAINSTVNVTCQDTSSLSFTVISNLTLENLTLDSCGTLVLTDLLDLNLLGVGIKPSYVNETTIVLYWILNATNILGTSSISGLHIISPLPTISLNVLQIMYYNDHFAWPLPVHNQLTMKDSILSYSQEGQLQITFELDQSMYEVSLLLDNLTIVADIMGNVYLTINIGSVASNNVTLMNSYFTSTCPRQSSSEMDIFDTAMSNTSIYIKNCTISSLELKFVLKSTQVAIDDTVIDPYTDFLVFDRNCRSFVVNNVTFTGGPQTDVDSAVVSLYNVTNLKFINCKFRSTILGGVINLQNAVVWIEKSSNVNFTNCKFSNNKVTSIVSLDSTFILSGSNTFSNNISPRGGAMALYGQSYVTLANGSDIQFINNSAETVGGTIYVDYELNAPCFFVVEGEYLCSDPFNATDLPVPPISMRFEGNVAENGGTSVYGALLDTCYIVNSFSCKGWTFVNNLFHINQRNGSVISAITSEPLRACLCDEDGKPSCTTLFSNRTVYPGEPFNVSAVVVGDRFGTIDGSVYAQLLPLHRPYVAELEHLELSQRVTHMKCTNLSYTVLSNSANVSIILTANSARVQQYPDNYTINGVHDDAYEYETTGAISSTLRSFPVFINITLLPCPLGFMLSGEPYQCICDTRLQDNHIPCNLTTQTVQRSGTEWVNVSFHNNTSNGVTVNKYCPNNYCKPETVNISLEHPDTQCAFNHSGILCGGCQSGLSLALGSAQCRSCSNNYLALLIPFALAGFALVFFIKLLNLTVAKGTLNGLIFYANIVRANQVAWIPGHDMNILTVFIAWINLDLGIETCFFNGLDAYWKTWLQFVFPLYIWAIVILIIILSRYSNAAKIFGGNSVPVLATLFLLSYSKLIRTIISIFQASTLDYPERPRATVWSYDGNIPYFSGKHIPLLFVALIVLLFLWLPYTGALLFAQCFQRSNHTVAVLMVKFKPFFDAYFGPLKDKHRYWVGLLLLVRGALFVVYAATPTSMPGIDLLATAMVVLCLLMYPFTGWVYKCTYLNLLDTSMFVNLGVVAMGTLYIQVSGGSQTALAYTSVGIAAAQFVAIVLFHAVISVKETRWFRSVTQDCVIVRDPQEAAELEQLVPKEPEVNREGVQELRVTFNEYREPMLKYLDDQ